MILIKIILIIKNYGLRPQGLVESGKLNNIKQFFNNNSNKLLLKNLNKLELQEYNINNNSNSYDDTKLD